MKTKMKQQLQAWLDAHTPMGVNENSQVGSIIGFLIGTLIAVLVGFYTEYDYYLGNLYADSKRTQLINPEKAHEIAVYMPSFDELYDTYPTVFGVISLFFAAMAIYNYRSHFQGSKSIYLMKRLPDDKDLMRRCLTLPGLGILACIIIALILTGFCYWIYMTFTPEAYLR